MGKAGKARRSLEKKSKKRAQKNAQQAQYAKWAAEGRNSKSKRFLSSTKKNGRRMSVRDPACKNIGDLVSHPEMIGDVARLHHTDRVQRIYRTYMGLPVTRQYQGKYKGLMRNRIVRQFGASVEFWRPELLRSHTGRPLTKEELAV